MRVKQPVSERGSLKWMQQAVADRWADLEQPILAGLEGAKELHWLSPRKDDEFAEYRDTAWLRRLDLGKLGGELPDFWPTRGPQWDALARSDAQHVILVEAKAHIAEFCSPPSQASSRSLALIEQSLGNVAADLGVVERKRRDWSTHFYQYTNRLAHLHWLRAQNVDAKLVLVGFVHDDEMPGRPTKEAWDAAYIVADSVLGLPKRHALSRHIIHVHPQVDRH